MSTTCQNCQGKAQVFLCARCQGELRQMLADLPWWIDRLAEAAVGHAKLGDGGRAHTPEGIARYADERIDEDTGERVGDDNLRRDIAAGRLNRDRVLAAGRVNARASRLLDRVQNSLTTIVRDVCESRGVDLPPSVATAPKTGVAACHRIARWLSSNLGAISAGEDAGQTFREIQGLMGDGKRDGEIAKLINRPVQPRFCGPCPTYVDHNRHCGKLLYAKREAIEVYCPVCRATHNVDRITQHLTARINVLRFTSSEVLVIMNTLGTPIPERSWLRWRKDGRVKIRGFKRPDNHDGTRGAIRINRHSDDDEPTYRLEEVRKVYGQAIRHADAMTCEMTAM